MVTHRLLEFKKINKDALDSIANFMSELENSDIDSYMTSNENRDFDKAIKGDVITCINKINEIVGKDYATNIVEEKSEPWSFDYVLEKEGESELQLMTRLYAPDGEQGDIFYGMVIIRLDSSNYAIWSDYE